jgi:hypothetical protein
MAACELVAVPTVANPTDAANANAVTPAFIRRALIYFLLVGLV